MIQGVELQIFCGFARGVLVGKPLAARPSKTPRLLVFNVLFRHADVLVLALISFLHKCWDSESLKSALIMKDWNPAPAATSLHWSSSLVAKMWLAYTTLYKALYFAISLFG